MAFKIDKISYSLSQAEELVLALNDAVLFGIISPQSARAFKGHITRRSNHGTVEYEGKTLTLQDGPGSLNGGRTWCAMAADSDGKVYEVTWTDRNWDVYEVQAAA